MRFVSATVALILVAAAAPACDYSLSGVYCPAAVVAAPVVYAAPAPVVTYSSAVQVQQVQVRSAFVQPYAVQQAFVPRYSAAFASHGYGAAVVQQKAFVKSAAVVRSPAVVRQQTVERRGLFGRRVIRSSTVIR